MRPTKRNLDAGLLAETPICRFLLKPNLPLLDGEGKAFGIKSWGVLRGERSRHSRCCERFLTPVAESLLAERVPAQAASQAQHVQ
jgi:hypothetical protein